MSDNENRYEDGGFDLEYQCIDAVVYGCTDPAAANYNATANFNSMWKHGNDYCDRNAPCMGPHGAVRNAGCDAAATASG